jgi:hypothetical protein
MNTHLPDLTFKQIEYGNRETPWSFNSLYYVGLSSIKISFATSIIGDKTSTEPDASRAELCVRLYEALQGEITLGRSPATVKGTYQNIRSFFGWADANSIPMDMKSAEQAFLDWCDWQFDNSRGNPTAAQSAFSRCVRVGSVIDSAFHRSSTIISLTRLRKRTKPRDWKRDSDKVNFEKLFKMGGVLHDICNSLTIEKIQGELPIKISAGGRALDHWCGLIPSENLKWNGLSALDGKPLLRRQLRMDDRSWKSRHSIMNLRIEAEILIFIAQTQINLTQALDLENSKVAYQSTNSGYRVSNLFKGRRGGTVTFDIYSEYRQHFESYLKWRNQLFPDDPLLFPLKSHNTRTIGNGPTFGAVRKILTKLDIEYIPPRMLRLSKVNWLLRKTRDPSLTAEMAQHAEATLLMMYEKPNHQAALSEISRFHQAQEAALSSPGPGLCVTPQPILIKPMPKGMPRPDCINPAGCLFCQHQRDIAELDHVWSLYSYRYLKSVELAIHRPPADEKGDHPAKAVVDVITEKLEAFSKIEIFKPWLSESATRVEEGKFHPKWDGFIKLMEFRL